jgi:hypothetical protein
MQTKGYSALSLHFHKSFNKQVPHLDLLAAHLIRSRRLASGARFDCINQTNVINRDKINMEIIKVVKTKIIGGGIAVIGLVLTVFFAAQTSLSIRLESWLSQEYWVQFMPIVSSMFLLIAGMLAFFERPNANFTLALFGHTISEEIMFGWLGLTNISASFFNLLGLKNINFPDYAILWFFGLSLISLFIAYSNVLNLRRVTLGEALIGIATGVVVSFLPNFL